MRCHRVSANEVEIASLCRYLILENINETWFKIQDEIIQKRTRSLNAKFGSLPDIDLKNVIYRKTNAIKLAQLKEIMRFYRDWDLIALVPVEPMCSIAVYIVTFEAIVTGKQIGRAHV